MFALMAPYRKHLTGVALLMLVSAAVDVALPLFQSAAIRLFITPNTTEGLLRFFLMMSAVVLLQAIICVIFSRMAYFIELSFGRDLKRLTFERLQQLSFSYYNKTPVGYMLARVMSDTNRISLMVAWGLIDFLWSFSYVAGVFAAMLVLSPRLALPILCIVPVVAGMTLWFQNRILEANRRVRRSNSRITGAFNEGITGAKTSKTLRMEQRNDRDFETLTARMYERSRVSARLSAIFAPLVLFCGSTATAIVLWRGGALVMDQMMDFAVLSAFIVYSISIFEPVQSIARLFSEFVAMQANIERVEGLLEAEPDVRDSDEVVARYGDCFSPKLENFEPIKGDIVFEDVSFTYGGEHEMVLEQFNLTVPAGSMVALVGETGAGKSTIVNLLCRFFEPTKGRILIDGRDYRERSQLWLHSNLGYVLQSPHLFSGSIADNIRYGRLEATDEEVREAARLVHADRIAASQPEGYDFNVGEGGDRLSTGEKQLISFARAILADPAIFVLDEATSSIDTETEQLIQEAIETLLHGRTSFIIAHRLSTIRRADIILVISGGRVIEMGSHRELIEKRGHYYHLYTRQYSDSQTDQVFSSGDAQKIAAEN
ncbi:MAG: ABC transporter ATP-binding protein [Clostridia bacterium]|nr:ABC transporter ATP-binding protein [Clostridia bacterium]